MSIGIMNENGELFEDMCVNFDLVRILKQTKDISQEDLDIK